MKTHCFLQGTLGVVRIQHEAQESLYYQPGLENTAFVSPTCQNEFSSIASCVLWDSSVFYFLWHVYFMSAGLLQPHNQRCCGAVPFTLDISFKRRSKVS